MTRKFSDPINPEILETPSRAYPSLKDGKLLVFFSVLPVFLSRVTNEIRKHNPGLKTYGIALGRWHKRTALAEGGEWESITLFSDAVREFGLEGKPDLAYLADMERHFGRPSLNLMATADWEAKSYPAEKMWRFLEIGFRFLSRVMDEVQPDAIISEGIDCGLTHILYSLAKARGIPFVFPASGRLAGRIAIIGNPHDRWERAEQLQEQFSMTGVPSELRRLAEEYLDAFLNAGPPKPGIHYVNRKQVVRRGDLDLMMQVHRVHSEDPEDYTATSVRNVLTQRLGRVARARKTAEFYRMPEAGDKFVMFPLHVQPEATTMTLAPLYVDQPALIANIARSLPAGYWVYVKEHPYAVGRRPLDEYRRIAAVPNAKLIPTNANVRELLLRSAGVTTITGTMGMEGLMAGLPVITFSTPFYTMSGLTYDVSDLRELPNVLRKALLHHDRRDRETVVRFLAAAFGGSYEGQIGYDRVSPPETMEAANVARIAAAFEEEIGRRMTVPARSAEVHP